MNRCIACYTDFAEDRSDCPFCGSDFIRRDCEPRPDYLKEEDHTFPDYILKIYNRYLKLARDINADPENRKKIRIFSSFQIMQTPYVLEQYFNQLDVEEKEQEAITCLMELMNKWNMITSKIFASEDLHGTLTYTLRFRGIEKIYTCVVKKFSLKEIVYNLRRRFSHIENLSKCVEMYNAEHSSSLSEMDITECNLIIKDSSGHAISKKLICPKDLK